MKIELDKELKKTRQKEQKFLLVLQGLLVAKGYSVAIPLPDMGEDLWVGEPVDKSKDKHSRIIYRVQAKSLYTCNERIRTNNRNDKFKYIYDENDINAPKPLGKKYRSDLDRRDYDVNDILDTFNYAITQPFFVYYFGLRDERLEKETGNPFYIGCLPMRGFFNYFTKYIKLAEAKDERVKMLITTEHTAENRANDKFELHINNIGNFDVTPFFRKIDYGLIKASEE